MGEPVLSPLCQFSALCGENERESRVAKYNSVTESEVLHGQDDLRATRVTGT